MSAKKHRQARAEAYARATRFDLWRRVEQSIKLSPWQRFKAKWSQAFARLVEREKARRYRLSLKHDAHAVEAASHDPEIRAFVKARNKIMKRKGGSNGQ